MSQLTLESFIKQGNGITINGFTVPAGQTATVSNSRTNTGIVVIDPQQAVVTVTDTIT